MKCKSLYKIYYYICKFKRGKKNKQRKKRREEDLIKKKKRKRNICVIFPSYFYYYINSNVLCILFFIIPTIFYLIKFEDKRTLSVSLSRSLLDHKILQHFIIFCLFVYSSSCHHFYIYIISRYTTIFIHQQTSFYVYKIY